MSGKARKRPVALMGAATFFCLVATIGPAAAGDMMELGLLECNAAPSASLNAGPSKSMACRFTDTIGIDNEGGYVANRPDFYRGSVKGVGEKIDLTQQQVVAWAVFAPAGTHYDLGTLAGAYTGVPTEKILGLGLGANVLLGGFTGSFVLQPSGVEAQTTAKFATGVDTFTLVAL